MALVKQEMSVGKDFWINSELQLFRVDEYTQVYEWLSYSTITSVWWKNDNEGRFKIKGLFPGTLSNLEDGNNIEILHRIAGRRDEYDSTLVVAKLNDCQIKRKWFLNISPDLPDNQEIFVLYISLTCKVELLI